MKRLPIFFALLLAAGGLTSAAQGATFQICVKADVLTTDASLTANGVTEDYWKGADDPVEYLAVGRGFRVKVRQGAWVQTFDSHPESGCFSFNRTSATGFDIRVYGFATDSAGNHVRIHDAGTSTSSWYPGATYSALWTGQTLSSVSANEYVLDGRASDRWTTIAAAAFGLHRYHDGNSGKTISIGFDEGDCNDSGSINGNAPDYVESNDAHIVRIGRCASTSSDAREKMLVTHEQGHAMLRMYYGFDGDDAPRDQGYTPPNGINPAAPPQGSSCWNVSSYGMNSLEWNSQAFKEAFADFYSAKVWNAKDSRGTYTYRGIAYDLEFWDNFTETNPFGGFTDNFCGSTANGVTTKGDMLRFLWDFFTVTGCVNQPSQLDMFEVYRMVRENHRDGTYNLTNSNYDAALKFAIENSVAALSGCEQDAYDAYAGWNGLH
ncbi:MAG TPA: hypothetical protein VKK31_03125 [Thermoanaerobaculia bacterium]|nr:hypothetical protein [Thermoanaerobaculia bacterium]